LKETARLRNLRATPQSLPGLRFDKKEKMLFAAPSEHVSNEQPASGKTVRSVLSVHNYYQQAGGEDRVFEGEIALLERHGHRVLRHADHNERLGNGSLGAVRDAVWSASTYQHLKALTRSNTIDVAHFHNTFPLISPSAYYAVQRVGISVVQTLHNFRLVCPGATLSRNGFPCQSCLDRQTLLPGIAHGCYRNSRPATAALSTMLAVHRAAGTYPKRVDVYVASANSGGTNSSKAGFLRIVSLLSLTS